MFTATRNTALRQARAHLRFSRSSFAPQSTSFARLLSSLALLEQRDGKLDPSSLTAVAAALKLGGSVTGFVAGAGTKAAAEEASKVKGVEKVLYSENSAYDRVSDTLGESSTNDRGSLSSYMGSLKFLLTGLARDFQKTMRHWWSRTLRKEVIHTFSSVTRRLERMSCQG